MNGTLKKDAAMGLLFYIQGTSDHGVVDEEAYKSWYFCSPAVCRSKYPHDIIPFLAF